jgi:hypothetical protein
MKWLRLTPGTFTVLATLLVVGGVVFSAGGGMFSPGPLSADSPRNTPLGGVSSHAALAGNCSACHTSPLSRARMSDRCMDCHASVREEMHHQKPIHGTLSADLNCQVCHTEHRGAHAQLTNLANFDHTTTGFRLTGAHEAVNCAQCHQNNQFKGTPQTCVSCHAEPPTPKVHKVTYGTACVQCHSTTTWKEAKFDHDATGFKLTGKHMTATCASCHKNSDLKGNTVFKGTPQSCVSCHAAPAVPTVHKVNYGNDCARCHTTATFASAKFDHDSTAFKLTGKHTTAACASCHKNSDPKGNTVFKGTPQSCVSCHAEPAVPAVHKVNYGSDCARCHTTATFAAAKFDHDSTAFKLTGKHTTTACAACHKNDVFKGTPQTCVGCHAEPPTPKVHKAAYGTDCVHCHTTTTFAGATFKHTFPINHGNRRMGGAANACAVCHKDAPNFKTNTCYGCHAHTPAKMEAVHARRKIADISNCAKCHKGGRGGERAATLDPDLLEALALRECPMDAGPGRIWPVTCTREETTCNDCLPAVLRDGPVRSQLAPVPADGFWARLGLPRLPVARRPDDPWGAVKDLE